MNGEYASRAGTHDVSSALTFGVRDCNVCRVERRSLILEQFLGYLRLLFVAMVELLAVLRRYGRRGELRVGHLWVISLVCYLLGYFVDLFPGDLVVALDLELTDSGSLVHSLRLFPVWLLVTLLFVHPWAHGMLAAEVARLSDLNARLSARLPEHFLEASGVPG